MRKFYESLHGLQMDSPRSQASLVLMLTNVRSYLAQTLSAPIDADELIDYSGIDADAPIALGSWTAANARDSIASAERKAIVLRVKDRARFERNLDSIQCAAGGIRTLTDGVGGMSRAIAVLPAGIPFIAQAILSTEPPKPSTRPFPVLNYSFLTDKEWNGLKLRVIESRATLSDWTIADDVTYIAYLGDTAILAPDLASLRDVLTNASAGGERKLLADNAEFRQAIDSGGDVSYFSDIKAVFAEAGDTKVRAGERTAVIARSDLDRVLLLTQTDSAKASRLADELLKSKPTDTGLRYLKGMALLDGDKHEDGVKLLTELANEGFAPAVHLLATEFSDSDDETETKKALELYQRYVALEPYDPRGFSQLGSAYEDAEQFSEAAAAYRKAIEIDPADIYNYESLIELLLTHDSPGDVSALLVADEKQQEADEDLFGWVIRDLVLFDEAAAAKKLAAVEPLRMKTSALANLSFGEMFTYEGRYLQAERSLNLAVQLSKQSPETAKNAVDAYVALAKLYRKQSRWLTALKATDQAIAVDASSGEAHYQRACALARLHRFDEALAALSKTIEISPYKANALADEPDLKPLANLPAFKKLLPPAKKEP